MSMEGLGIIRKRVELFQRFCLFIYFKIYKCGFVGTVTDVVIVSEGMFFVRSRGRRGARDGVAVSVGGKHTRLRIECEK